MHDHVGFITYVRTWVLSLSQVSLHLQPPGYLQGVPGLSDDHCSPLYDGRNSRPVMGPRVLSRILRPFNKPRGSAVVRGARGGVAASIPQGDQLICLAWYVTFEISRECAFFRGVHADVHVILTRCLRYFFGYFKPTVCKASGAATTCMLHQLMRSCLSFQIQQRGMPR